MTDEEQLLVSKNTNKGNNLPTSSSQALDVEEQELNEIYEHIGVGPAQYIYWLLVGLMSYAEYAEITMISVIILPMRCQWDLSLNYEICLTVTVLGSYALCAGLFGNLADKYGRKTVMSWSTVGFIVTTIICAAAPNKWVFICSRLVAGACIGINTTTVSCYAVEFAESKYRIVGITIFIFTGYIGLFLVNLLAWALLNTIGWRWFIILVTAPAVPSLALILYLPGSPRYLCATGQQEKAMATVRFMARLNGTQIPDNIRMICHKNQDTGSFLELFSERHRRSTISLALMFFMNMVAEYGIVLFLPLFFSNNICGSTSVVPEHGCDLLSQGNLYDLTLAAGGAILGSVLAIVLAQLIGRLIPVRVATFLQAVSMVLFFVCVNKTVTFWEAMVGRSLIAFNNGVLWVLMPETFPTYIRSTAVGMLNGLGKIGAVLGTGSVYLFFYTDPNIVLGVFLASSVIGFIGSLIFNKETKNLDLTES